VLYVLDGDDHFTTMLQISRNRGLVGEIAEIVVVGVGTQLGADMATYSARRIYDFTSPDWDPSSPVHRALQERFTATGRTLRIGGAPAMRDFLIGDLQPLISSRYRVDAGNQGIFGCSAAGNFVGNMLFHATSAFSEYIVASPAFSFGDFEVVRLEARHASGHDDLPVTLYLAAGSDETLQYAHLPIVSGMVQLAENLRRRHYPSLRMVCELLPGKTHQTAATEAMHRGLEICWPGIPFEATLAHAKDRLGHLGDMT
jgi:predicted alpha/beta superfamily hydrolase